MPRRRHDLKAHRGRLYHVPVVIALPVFGKGEAQVRRRILARVVAVVHVHGRARLLRHGVHRARVVKVAVREHDGPAL